ncbi:hypothetical protein BDEG_20776 [Batrachochytrium dendrobatidis JEL423]|uniref:Small RNA 2'-O-methyltransferase n=3 Tax=Batrachochytrium dendrobatidis (strain JEL423) TaxID=403673 RepID=A0A177W937_BATDL|nr:hypothetical protein BDEG_20776 [Batrachochytrium dendrobatidis JEL423]
MNLDMEITDSDIRVVSKCMDQVDDKTFFSPALWRQRRTLASTTLKLHNAHKVCDIGCGEGALLQILLNDTQFTYLAGVDADSNVLSGCHYACQPSEMDHAYLRELPVELDLFHGSLDQPDERFVGFDAMTCLEVIEHLDPPVLATFPAIVLGLYRPSLLIVSTPNAEYNVYFSELQYGTSNSKFRHDDHRFEWDRPAFQEWATTIASKYGYNVTFTGVGIEPMDIRKKIHDVGFCSQFAIFCKKEDVLFPSLTFDYFAQLGVSPPQIRFAHVSRTTFPYFEETGFTDANIIQEIQDRVPYLITPPKDSSCLVIPSGSIIEVDELWSMLRIRQICKTRTRLIDALRSTNANKIFELSADGQKIAVMYEVPVIEYTPWVSPTSTASIVSDEELATSSDDDCKEVKQFKNLKLTDKELNPQHNQTQFQQQEDQSTQTWGQMYEDVLADTGTW